MCRTLQSSDAIANNPLNGMPADLTADQLSQSEMLVSETRSANGFKCLVA